MGAPCILPPASASSSSTFCSSVNVNVSSSSSPPFQSSSLSVRHPRRRLGLRGAGSDSCCSSYSVSRHVQFIQRPVLRRAQQDAQQDTGLTTVNLEDGGVAVEGVIKVDKERTARPSWRRVFTLAGGDLVALLVFASIGRISHGMPAFNWEVIRTADPFIAGWLLGAYFMGGFGPEGQGLYGIRSAAVSTVKSWAIGIPLALGIRALIAGHAPAPVFVLVSMGSTLVLLVGWRAAFTALFPSEDASLKNNGIEKKGSIFELFELLTSLVRRW